MEKRTKALDKMRDMARKKHNKQQYDLDYLGNVDFYKKCIKKAQPESCAFYRKILDIVLVPFNLFADFNYIIHAGING